MKVKNLVPDARIAEFVERILVIENDKITVPFALPLFANGTPTLLFTSIQGTIRNNSATHFILFGQTILPESITFNESFTLIAYFFKPHSLISLFGVAAQILTDSPIDLNLLAGQKSILLQEQLLNADTVERKINLLDSYISSLIKASRNNCPMIEYAANRISLNPSNNILGLVQKELFTTERTFQRLFEKNIGIAPGTYRRICQFNNAFQQLNRRHFGRLTDLAFENGYADQSHFIRSFKEFTNLTPKDFLNLGSLP